MNNSRGIQICEIELVCKVKQICGIWTVIKINIVPVVGIIYNVMEQKPGFRTVPVMGLEFIPVSTMKMLVLHEYQGKHQMCVGYVR